MASNFVIFEDQENFVGKQSIALEQAKRDKTKTIPLGLKTVNNENAGELQNLKPGKVTADVNGPSRAFRDKNIFTQNNVVDEGKLKVLKDDNFGEDMSINHENLASNDSWASSSCLEASASFTYRKEDNKDDDQLATPMSVAEMGMTPMSVDKSEYGQKILAIRNDRDRFFEVSEYQKDILIYLKSLEKQKHIRPRSDYMDKQPDIKDAMRSILIDWLVEVSEEYRLHGETLCLAVHYIDRFLSYMSVVRAKLQLVGTTAMFVASKYEEIYPPEIGEFVYITDDTYTKQQILRMEKLLLKVLTFDLNVPTSVAFINLFTAMMNIPDKIKFMAQYFCELSMLKSTPFLQYSTSQLSSAAIALAYYTHGSTIWNKKMQDTFGYDLDEIKDCIIHLNELHFEADGMQQQAIQEKYKGNKYAQASTVKPKKVSADELDEMIAKFCEGDGDELNSTAENIESVRQKTEMLFN